MCAPVPMLSSNWFPEQLGCVHADTDTRGAHRTHPHPYTCTHALQAAIAVLLRTPREKLAGRVAKVCINILEAAYVLKSHPLPLSPRFGPSRSPMRLAVPSPSPSAPFSYSSDSVLSVLSSPCLFETAIPASREIVSETKHTQPSRRTDTLSWASMHAHTRFHNHSLVRAYAPTHTA